MSIGVWNLYRHHRVHVKAAILLPQKSASSQRKDKVQWVISGGGQVDRDRTGKMSSRKISGKWASAGTRLKRLWKTGGPGGIVSPNVSLTWDEPGTRSYFWWLASGVAFIWPQNTVFQMSNGSQKQRTGTAHSTLWKTLARRKIKTIPR